MGNWVNRTTNKYLPSQSPRHMDEVFELVFTDGAGKAVSNAEWIYQPDISAVTRPDGSLWQNRYWAIAGDNVRLLNSAQRQAVDDQALSDTRDAQADQILVPGTDANAVAEITLDEINDLRVAAGKPPKTLQDYRNAYRGKLNR